MCLQKRLKLVYVCYKQATPPSTALPESRGCADARPRAHWVDSPAHTVPRTQRARVGAVGTAPGVLASLLRFIVTDPR